MKNYEIAEIRKSDGKILDCHRFDTTDELISYFMGFMNGVICKDGYYIGSDYNDLKKILKKIDSPNLGVCFDWGHANNYSRVQSWRNN